MIVVSSVLKARPGKEKELEDALRSVFPSAQNEPGLFTYILHRSTNDPGKFLFYERYMDKDSLDYHLSTPYFQDSFMKVKSLVAEEPVVELFEEIDAIRR
jgi:quinol monooxygenase YgiN